GAHRRGRRRMTGSVILVGGTSYVAQGVIRALAPGDRRILAVTRRPAIARILLADVLERVEPVTAEDGIERAAGSPCVVVNLAYVATAPKHQLYPQTHRLIESVERIAVATGSSRLIHTSTVAVFGYTFQRPPQPVRASWRPGDGYTDLKT